MLQTADGLKPSQNDYFRPTKLCWDVVMQAMRRRHVQGVSHCGHSNIIPRHAIKGATSSSHGWQYLMVQLIPKAGSTTLTEPLQRLVNDDTVKIERSKVDQCGHIVKDAVAAGHRIAINNTLAAVAVRDPFSRSLAGVAEIVENHCSLWIHKFKQRSATELKNGIELPGLHPNVSRFQLAVVPGNVHQCRLIPHGLTPTYVRKHNANITSFRWDENAQTMAAVYESVLASMLLGFQDVHVMPQAAYLNTAFGLPKRLIRLERMEADLRSFMSEAGLSENALMPARGSKADGIVSRQHTSAERGNRAWNLTLDTLPAPTAMLFCRAYRADYLCIKHYRMPCACNCSCSRPTCGW